MNMNEALIQAMTSSFEGIILTDPHQADNPIVYVNDAFCAMTGYSKAEIIGENCRFLQGINTDIKTTQQIYHAISCDVGGVFHLYNYKKNGEGFWNRLAISPVKDQQGKTLYFAGFQSDITDIYHAQAVSGTSQKDLTRVLNTINFDVMKTVQSLEAVHGENRDIKKACTQIIHQTSLMMTMIKDNSTDIMNFVALEIPQEAR